VKFTALPLTGAFLVELTPFADHRGSFLRTFDGVALEALGLDARVTQAALSTNHRKGTLRGLHFQLPPAAESKTVMCWQGALFDVIVDLRAGSATYGESWTTVLRAGDHRMVHAPTGFAHGFQALEDDTVGHYVMSAPYTPALARGVRWDDPDLAIPWPIPQPILSERDANLPNLSAIQPVKSR
jgi:dTDP-4-dehydrorhamnose 3,5-epimerase